MAEEICRGCFLECERQDRKPHYPCTTKLRKWAEERRGPTWTYDEEKKTWKRKVLDDGWK